MKLIKRNIKIFEAIESGKIIARLVNCRTKQGLFNARLITDEKIREEFFPDFMDELGKP